MNDGKACARAAQPQNADDRRVERSLCRHRRPDEAKTLAHDAGLQQRIMPPEVAVHTPATQPLSFRIFGSRSAGAGPARLGETAVASPNSLLLSGFDVVTHDSFPFVIALYKIKRINGEPV
jgi:hypothetical protein